MKFNLLHNTAVTKQWTEKWPYIANAVFRIVLKLKHAFSSLTVGDCPPLDPSLTHTAYQLPLIHSTCISRLQSEF